MEKITKNKNGQWDIEKVELNLDKEIEESKSGKAKEEPDFPLLPSEQRVAARSDEAKDKQIKKPQIKLVKTEEEMEKGVKEKIEQLESELENLKKMTANDLKEKNRGKQLVGIKGYGSDMRVGGGPAMTGIPRHYQFTDSEGKPATTRSGKPIMSTNGPKDSEPYHADFTAEDHKDAYYYHGVQANKLRELKNQVHPDLISHHKAMETAHWEAYQDKLKQKRGY